MKVTGCIFVHIFKNLDPEELQIFETNLYSPRHFIENIDTNGMEIPLSVMFEGLYQVCPLNMTVKLKKTFS